MSSRVTRFMPKLYPRAIQDRYAQEMVELDDELKEHGDLSRPRLLWDMLGGALLLWRARSRQCVVAGAVLTIVGLTVLGTIRGSEHPDRLPQRLDRQLRIPTASVASGAPCFVGGPCPASPCPQFVEDGSINGGVSYSSVPLVAHPSRPTHANCVTYRPIQKRKTLYVGG
jgi:hypothetical protein